jgi:hypothetical protein
LYTAQTLIFRQLIVDFSAEERLPAMYPLVELAEAGGLMSYGASRIDLFRRAASYAAKILSGTNPRDRPIEQPTKFELIINLSIWHSAAEPRCPHSRRVWGYGKRHLRSLCCYSGRQN